MIAGPDGLLATIARWNMMLEGPAMTGTFMDPDPEPVGGPPSAGDEATGPTDRAQPSAGLLLLDVSATPEASDAAVTTLPPAPPTDMALAGRDFTATLGLASLAPPATLLFVPAADRGDAGQAAAPPANPAAAALAAPPPGNSIDGGAAERAPAADVPRPGREGSRTADGPFPAQTAALPGPGDPAATGTTAPAAAQADAGSAPVPAQDAPPSTGPAVTAAPRDLSSPTADNGVSSAVLSAEVRAATAEAEPRTLSSAPRSPPSPATPEAADRTAADRLVTDPDRDLRPPPSDVVVQARTAGGGIDLLNARTDAVLASLVAGSDPQPGAGTIIPSCIINAAMIPGWPPPRPFDHPAPKTLLGQMARQQTEAQLLDALARRGGGDINRWRQRLARLTRSRRLRTLLGFEAIMSTIEALIEAIEEELLRLSARDRSTTPGEDEQDDLAQSGLQQRLTA